MEAYHYSAKFYDPLISSLIRPIRKRIVSIVKHYRYERILDVCCGTGDQLRLLAQEGFRGEGIDLSESMLAVAKKSAGAFTCVQGDAAQMPFETESYDLTMIAFALHEKEGETARGILSEILRVTKEGGDVLIVDYAPSEETSPLYRRLITFIEWIAGGEHYRNFKSYTQNGGLQGLLEGLPLREKKRYVFAGGGVVLLLLEKGGDHS
jgi:demethylmenaquinone methyltransferase/2-methoxy-6-polyprenyl-1,4-benzoquinol methylase